MNWRGKSQKGWPGVGAVNQLPNLEDFAVESFSQQSNLKSFE